MKRNIIYGIVVLVACIWAACQEDEQVQIATVDIENAEISASYSHADIQWKVSSESTISEVYVEYSTDSAFSEYREAVMTKVEKKENQYTISLDSLADGQKYYLRCRAVNRISSYVSGLSSFTTLAYSPAVVQTDSVDNVSVSSAQIHATLLKWGSETLPSAGFYFALHEGVTEKDSCINCRLNGKTDTIPYSYTLTELADNTTYYVRAFALNNKGLTLGEELSFTTVEIVVPTIGETNVSTITYTTAVCTSEIVSDGGSEVTERGICYSEDKTPTLTNHKVVGGSGTGSFTCNLSDLTDGTTYFVRAYAINSKGTSYGEQVEFKTIEYGVPIISTSNVTDISYTTATCGGNVTDDGGKNITERGICYATTKNPTIEDNKVACGSGIGLFTCAVTDLVDGTTYYVRAFATNEKGISYGNEVSFVTNVVSSSVIYYTSNEQLQETIGSTTAYKGLHMNNFGGATIVSHTFENGQGTIVFNSRLTSIGNYAFYYCAGLTSVTIPNSVTSIGHSAFAGCSGLTSIEIPNSVTSIGEDAFSGCNSLPEYNDIRYADTYLVKVIDKSKFSYTIREGTKWIGSSAFTGCNELISFDIPNSVTSIGRYAFEDCRSLTSITIPNSVTSIGMYAFKNCTGLTSIEIPNSVTSIGKDAFNNCTGLTSVTIPNSVTIIEKEIFLDCSSLTSVTIPNSITSIGEAAFKNCESLASVTIPNKVTSIGNSAFSGCSNITTITWNATNCADFSDISNNPFYNIRTQITSFSFGVAVNYIPAYICYGMTNLTSIVIPNGVTNIGSSAFSGCSGLTTVVWNARNCVNFSSFKSSPFYNICSQITSFSFGVAVNYIPAYICYGMTNLTSIVIKQQHLLHVEPALSTMYIIISLCMFRQHPLVHTNRRMCGKILQISYPLVNKSYYVYGN